MTSIEPILLRSGLYINKKQLLKLEENKLKSKFKLSYTNPLKLTSYLTLYNEVKTAENNFLVLPIYEGLAMMEKAKITVKNNIVRNPQINIQRAGKPTENQQIIADHIMKEYYSEEMVKRGLSRLILNLDTGQGKSYLAVELICRLRASALIIVPNSTLLMDWYGKVLTKEFPPDQVGLYYSKEKKLGNIMVMVINSAVQSDEFKFIQGKGKNKKEISFKPTEFFKLFDLIVLDESHSYCSKENSKIFWNLAPYVLGLSATPTETTFYKASLWGIGPILNATDISGFKSNHSHFDGKVRVIKYIGPPQYTQTIINEKNGITSSSQTLNLIIKDPFRMSLVVEEACRLVKDHFVFVFSDRCALNLAFAELVKKKMPNIRCDVIMGGATKEQMEDSEKNANMIVSTYSYMSTGKSIPKMSAIVKLTPRKSKTRQIDGRIMRLGGDETIVREIIDIVDWNTVFKSQFYSRNKFYTLKGFAIDTHKISYRDLEKADFKVDGDDSDSDNSDNTDEKNDDNETQKANEKNEKILELLAEIYDEP